MTRGGLAALFGADAADGDAVDMVAREPDIEPGADERAVAILREGGRGVEVREACERTDMARLDRERVLRRLGAVAVKDPDDRRAGLCETGDQSILGRQVRRQIALGEERAMAERLLDVDHNETGLHGRKLRQSGG